MPRINEAVKLTVDDLLTELQRILEGTVYFGGGSEFMTGAFYDHWEKILTGVVGQHCGGILQLDQSWFGTDITQWQHGNIYYGENNPEDFARWYNDGTPKAGFGFPTVPSFGYWDKFEEFVDNNLEDILIGHLRRLGLYVL